MNKTTVFNEIFNQKEKSILDIYNNETIGDKIKLLRIKSGLTYNQFAKKIGVSIMTIYRWEKGIRIPNDIYLDIIAQKFNIDLMHINVLIK